MSLQNYNRCSRRSFLLGAAATATVFVSPAKAAHSGISIGAIRWDPWYEPNGGAARAAVEHSLGPAAYQERAPACAVSTGVNTISLSACGTQAQIDTEIAEAHAASLDYWAYCWYGPSNDMSVAWMLHQSSSVKEQMNWCLLFSRCELLATEMLSIRPTLINYLTQLNYQKIRVLGVTRPLVYLLVNDSSIATLASSINAFRAACIPARLESPYIVLLGGAATAATLVASGADAVGVYAYAPSVINGTYPALAASAEGEWSKLAASGLAVVPTAMTGWDRRPRIDRPVPWEASRQVPHVGENNYYAAGTPKQIAAHVSNMVNWMRHNAAANPSRTGLVYSWDEHDEGGSTLNPSIGGRSAILSAIDKVL